MCVHVCSEPSYRSRTREGRRRMRWRRALRPRVMASLPGILRRRLLTNLPPIFHPFALQTAAWIHNRLPRPGCLIFYHRCLFHWFSKMQKSVSLSSAEAEYFGAMMAARDLIFVRDLLIELAHLHDIGRKGSRSYVHLRVSHGVSFIREDQGEGLLWAVKQTKL